MFFIQEKWWSPLYCIWFVYTWKERFFTHWHSHEINFIMDFLTSINQIRPFLLSCFIKNIACWKKSKPPLNNLYGFQRTKSTLVTSYFRKENVQWMVEDLVHLYDRYKTAANCDWCELYAWFYISKDLIVKIEQIFQMNRSKYKMILWRTATSLSATAFETIAFSYQNLYLKESSHQKTGKVIMRISEYIFELKKKHSWINRKENQVTS